MPERSPLLTVWAPFSLVCLKAAFFLSKHNSLRILYNVIFFTIITKVTWKLWARAAICDLVGSWRLCHHQSHQAVYFDPLSSFLRGPPSPPHPTILCCIFFSLLKNNPPTPVDATHVLMGLGPCTGMGLTYQEPHS